MKLKIALSAATAIGLLAASGAAMAGSSNKAVVVQGLSGGGNGASITQDGGSSNTAKFIQDGNGNTAAVTQNGNNNEAGTHLQYGPSSYDPSEVARGYNFITQDGDNNGLTISQSANGNHVALDGKVVQTGDKNLIDITQHGGASAGGRVNTVLQTDSTGSAAATSNKLTVLQEGAAPGTYATGIGSASDYNYAYETITKVEQINSGGPLNELTLTQKGGVHNNGGGGNTIDSAYQNGSGNTGVVSQTGRGNLVHSLSQTGSGNDAAISVAGDRNGKDGLGHLTYGFAAAAAAGYDRSAVQDGTSNSIDFDAVGNANQFGFYQHGTDNTTNNVTLNGSFNEVGVSQDGDTNAVHLGSIIGNSNDVGVKQTGNANIATVNIFDSGITDSDGNAVSVEQASFIAPGYDLHNEATANVDGDNNWLRIKQVYGSRSTNSVTGDDNDIAVDQYNQATSTVTVTGNNNMAGLNQLNGATATVTINGDDNNRHAFSGGITSALAASTTSGLGAPMQVGGIVQNGASSVSLTVGLTGPSNDNRFSLNQSGDGNSIVGTIDGGNQNEAVVTQVGANNATTFTQLGGLNLVAIAQ